MMLKNRHVTTGTRNLTCVDFLKIRRPVVSAARAQSKNDARKKCFFISLNHMLKNPKKTADSLPTRQELSNDVLNVNFTQTDEKLAAG